nr:hypothetical protein Iba_chr15cCG2980 [Ipomoea batatas]
MRRQRFRYGSVHYARRAMPEWQICLNPGAINIFGSGQWIYRVCINEGEKDSTNTSNVFLSRVG